MSRSYRLLRMLIVLTLLGMFGVGISATAQEATTAPCVCGQATQPR